MSYLYTILAHILGYKPDNSALNKMNWTQIFESYIDAT